MNQNDGDFVMLFACARTSRLSSTLPSRWSFSHQGEGRWWRPGRKLGEALDAPSSKRQVFIALTSSVVCCDGLCMPFFRFAPWNLSLLTPRNLLWWSVNTIIQICSMKSWSPYHKIGILTISIIYELLMLRKITEREMLILILVRFQQSA